MDTSLIVRTLQWLAALLAVGLPPLFVRTTEPGSMDAVAASVGSLRAPPGASGMKQSLGVNWLEREPLEFRYECDHPATVPQGIDTARSGQRGSERIPCATAYVRNLRTDSVKIASTVALRTQRGRALEGSAAVLGGAIAPGVHAVQFLLASPATMPGEGRTTGYLTLAHEDSVVESRQIVVTPKPWPWLAHVLRLPLLVALGSIVVAAILILARVGNVHAFDRLGPPTWDFARSWATNITIAGGVLGSVLTFSFLPENTVYLSRAGYAALNLLFSILVVVAPTLFGLLRASAVAPAAPPGVDPQYQGTVLGFLVASVTTVWAVLGQLSVTWLLFRELQWARLIASPMHTMLSALLLVLAAALAGYAAYSVYHTVATLRVPKPAFAALVAAAMAGGASGPVRLPGWSVL